MLVIDEFCSFMLSVISLFAYVVAFDTITTSSRPPVSDVGVWLNAPCAVNAAQTAETSGNFWEKKRFMVSPIGKI